MTTINTEQMTILFKKLETSHPKFKTSTNQMNMRACVEFEMLYRTESYFIFWNIERVTSVNLF